MARKEATETVTPDKEVLDQVFNQGEGAQETTAMSTIQGNFALGTVQGEFSMEEMRLPRLQIAYGVGNLAENFNPGDFVLGGDNLLVHKGEPLRIIILTAGQYWKEYLSAEQFTAGLRPRSFLTEQEVHKEGGTTAWVNGVGPTFNRAMNIKMLIEQPKDVICGLFGVEIKDKIYAAAVWDVDKTAFKRVGPVVMSAAQFSLRTKGLLNGVFELANRVEKVGKNQNATVVPSIKLAGYNDDETIEAIKAVFGQ